jgi:hypothetical protein
MLQDLTPDAQGMTVDVGEETIDRQTERVRTLTFFVVHVQGRTRKRPDNRSASSCPERVLMPCSKDIPTEQVGDPHRRTALTDTDKAFAAGSRQRTRCSVTRKG